MKKAPNLARISGKTLRKLMDSDSGVVVFIHGEIWFAGGIVLSDESEMICQSLPLIDGSDLGLVVKVGVTQARLADVFQYDGVSFRIEHSPGVLHAAEEPNSGHP